LGFDSNEEKNTPPTQQLTFLGGGLDTNTHGKGVCSMYIDDEKRSYVIKQCLEIEHTAGTVRVSRIMSLLGLLSFCACVVEGMRPWLRSGFDLIKNKQPRDFVPLSRGFRLDLAYIRRLFDQATPRTMLVKRPLTTVFGSWDASTSWGMGGFLDGRSFSEKWSDFLGKEDSPKFYPRLGTATFHINYLELFAGYWFLKLWGSSLRGHTVVCHTDNTATEGMLKNLWGTATFIPLLKEILVLLRKYDISLSPQRISTKDNILSDCLSRGAPEEFQAEMRLWSGVSMTDKDMEDWMVIEPEAKSLDRDFGPFDVDACVDEYRTNSHCGKSWNKKDDCVKQQWGGLNVLCNGPFSMLLEILRHAVKCKRAHPVGTAALFIVPCWPTEEFYKFAMSLPELFKVVRRWPKGSALFTAPIPAPLGGGRVYQGPTRWPVVALRISPGAEGC
jgi:hypothetical protein